jgi:two-component system, LytTR family, sensor kinase
VGTILLVVAAAVLLVGVPLVVLWRVVRGRRDLGTPVERATYETLHTAAAAAPALRQGLTGDAASRSARHLRRLVGAPAVAVLDRTGLLAWDGPGDHHATDAADLASTVLDGGRAEAVGADRVGCGRPDCGIRAAVLAPLIVEERVVGVLAAYTDEATAGLVRATVEVAGWMSSQLELAELDASRARLAEAEVLALRAQISPHFVYNALTAIASYVRTDPEHARELLLEFADFTRYSFRRHGQFTTLAEELRSIDRYLSLERARFGDRLQVTVRVAPEVLPVVVPFLCLQPLVENAVRHGLEGRPGTGSVTIAAEDAGHECLVSVEDDGVGADPEHMRAILSGRSEADSVGVGNVDERMRSVYGDEYGLVVETAPGAGTKVSMRIPKYQPGVHA